MAFLDFLHEINYSDDISKYILERKQLHKVLEKIYGYLENNIFIVVL